MAGNPRHVFCLLFIGLVVSIVMVNSASVPLGDNEDGAGELVATRDCYTITAKKGVNVRARPTSDSRKLGALSYKAKVTVYGVVRGESVEGNNKWYIIRYQSTDAYITARYASIGCREEYQEDKSPLSDINTENLGSASSSDPQPQEPLA